MGSDSIEKVVKKMRWRAFSMQVNASIFFTLSICMLLGVAYLFLRVDASDLKYLGFDSSSNGFIYFGARVTLIIVVLYAVKILMGVVKYNLGLSNDIYSKSDVLQLYDPEGSLSLKELKDLLSVNHHELESAKSSLEVKDVERLVKAIKGSGQS